MHPAAPRRAAPRPAESFVQWSPRGNYVATMHRKGVAVWGGPAFNRLQRYSHDDVKLIEFSPGERYLMTYSPIRPHSPHEKLQVRVCVLRLEAAPGRAPAPRRRRRAASRRAPSAAPAADAAADTATRAPCPRSCC
jgi:hypothetical protein